MRRVLYGIFSEDMVLHVDATSHSFCRSKTFVDSDCGLKKSVKFLLRLIQAIGLFFN